jgi:hypothetical protein
MNNKFTAVIKQDGEWWIGWIEEVPGVNCQEATRDVLIDSLTVTLREALDFSRDVPVARLVALERPGSPSPSTRPIRRAPGSRTCPSHLPLLSASTSWSFARRTMRTLMATHDIALASAAKAMGLVVVGA